MKEKNTFNWGLIGPGRIANRFAEGFAALPDARLLAVASQNRLRGKAFADKHNISKVYESYENLVEDPEINAIYIATPHRFHYEQILLCFQAGKPVLCEKPLTVNAEQTMDLVKRSQEQKLFLMEALWSRYLPIYGQVRSWLDQKEVGEIKLLSSSFGFKVPRDLQDRLLNPEMAGGVLLDMGVYNVSISQWVLGKDPIKVSSQTYLGETGVDEMNLVNMDYGNGAYSQFNCGFTAQLRNDFVIHGTQGQIRIHNMFWDTDKATLTRGGQEITSIQPFDASGFEYQTREAMECIQSGQLESSRMPHTQTIGAMKIMDAIRSQAGFRYPFE